MSGCRSCGRKGVRSLFSTQLGRCPRCMRVSALVTLHGWAACTVIYFVWANGALLGLALLATFSFTLLLIAHIVASIRWQVAVLRRRRYLISVTAPTPNEPTLGRHEFFLSAGRIVLASLVGFSVGPRISLAQSGSESHRNLGRGDDSKGAPRALVPFSVRDYWYFQQRAVPEIPGRLEVIWTFTDSVFREFIIVENVAEVMNVAALIPEDDGKTFLMTDAIGDVNTGTDCACNLRVRLRPEENRLLIISGDNIVNIPFKHINAERQVILDIELITGQGQGPDGSFIERPGLDSGRNPRCCTLCFVAHWSIVLPNIHFLDCICCFYLGGCGFSCGGGLSIQPPGL
jgi:hypothetical protein